MSNIHDRLEDIVELYLENKLPQHELGELKFHVQECSECKNKFNDSVLVHEELALYLEEDMPSESVADRIIAGVNKRLSRGSFFDFSSLFAGAYLKPLTISVSVVFLMVVGYVLQNGVLFPALGALPASEAATAKQDKSEFKRSNSTDGRIHDANSGLVDETEALNYSRAQFEGRHDSKKQSGKADRGFFADTSPTSQPEQNAPETGNYYSSDLSMDKPMNEALAEVHSEELELSKLKGEVGEMGEMREKRKESESSISRSGGGKPSPSKGFTKELKDEVPGKKSADLLQMNQKLGGGSGSGRGIIHPVPQEQSLDQKIIKTGFVNIEVESYEETYQTARQLARKYNGYVNDLNTTRKPNGKVVGDIIVKVQVNMFELALEDFKKLGKLIDVRISSQDVTKHYVDLQSKLKTLRVMEERLLDILKTRKGEVKDLLEVERELGNRRKEIEQILGEIRYYDELTSFSTITISLKEKGADDPGTIIQTMSGYLTLRSDSVTETYKQLNELAVKHSSFMSVRSSNLVEAPQKENISARIQVLVDADKVDTVIDEIKKMNVKIETNKIDKRQRDDRPGYPILESDATESKNSPEIKKEKAVIDIYVYFIQKLQVGTGVINVRANDVLKLFEQFKGKLNSEFGAEILSANLSEAQGDSQVAYISFEVAPDITDRVIDYLKSDPVNVEIVNSSVQKNPPALVTKVAKEIVRINASINPPAGVYQSRNSGVVTIKSEDPGKTALVLKDLAGSESGVNIISSSTDSTKESTTVKMQLEVPADKFSSVVKKIEGAEGAVEKDVKVDEQVTPISVDPASRLIPRKIKMPGILSITVANKDQFIKTDDGFLATIKRTLQGSLTGLLKAFEWLVRGLAFALPFLVVLIFVVVLFRKYTKKPTPPENTNK
ncbi:MAG: DUF4349 domain-containing protein [Planctomycetes bacterium]|nr:DUF4349 domain-containing protein [Planctomycetota bacterium]